MLSCPWDQRKPAYDFVIVGSGYGGAITAARLATASLRPKPSICILERGKEWRSGSFPEKITEVLSAARSDFNPLGLYDPLHYQDISVLQGSGLGGTSLINANVVMRPDREAFEHAGWPRALAYEVLLPYYQKAEQILGAAPHPMAATLRKIQALDRRARELGMQPQAMNLAVNFSIDGPNPYGVSQKPCINCGNCVTGCQVGAQNTLAMNYLPMARSAGAEILTQARIQWIEKLSGGGWRLHGKRYGSDLGAKAFTIDAGNVILAAGAINSTEILMRSEFHGLKLSPAVGTGFSGNGDFLGVAYNGDVPTEVLGFATASELPSSGEATPPGPNIVGAIRYNADLPVERRFLVQEFSFPGASVEAAKSVFALVRGEQTAAGTEDAQRDRMLRDLNPLAPPREDGALNHTLAFLVTGFEDARGRIVFEVPWFEPEGRAKVVWDSGDRQIALSSIREELRRHARAMGANFISNPAWSLLNVSHHVTVYPLGGCPIGEDYHSGVVDEFGRVFAGDGSVHQGLFVADGALVPAALGVPPLLTISALAEYIAERKIRELGGDAYPRPRLTASVAGIDPAGVTDLRETELERMFRRGPSAGIETIVNGGAQTIDFDSGTIANDRHWRGFLPRGHVLNQMSAAFFPGILHSFQRQNGRYTGIAADHEQRMHVRISLEEISTNDRTSDLAGTCILARYLDSPWEGFHTVFKAIGDSLIIGRVYVGTFPDSAVRLFTFALARRYGIAQMTGSDHRALFEVGSVPAPTGVVGTWRIDAVWNANRLGAVAYLKLDLMPDGRLESRCQMFGLFEGLMIPGDVADYFQSTDWTPFLETLRESGGLLLGNFVYADSDRLLRPAAGTPDVTTIEIAGQRSFRYLLSRAGSGRVAGSSILQQYLDVRAPDGIGMLCEERFAGSYFPGVSVSVSGREGDLSLNAVIPAAARTGNTSQCRIRMISVISDVNEFVDSGVAHEAALRGTVSFTNFPGVGTVTCTLEEDRSLSGYVRIDEASGEAEIRYFLEFALPDSRRFLLEARKYLYREEAGRPRSMQDCLTDYRTLIGHLFEYDKYGSPRELGAVHLLWDDFSDVAASANLNAFLNLFTVTGTQDRALASFAKLRYLAFVGQFLRSDHEAIESAPASAAAAGIPKKPPAPPVTPADRQMPVIEPPVPAAPEKHEVPPERNPRLPSVWISYRRDDAAGHARLLYERLVGQFGPAQVTLDTAPVPDFADMFERTSCDALIVVIGKQWLVSSDSRGRRQMDEPQDIVRLEIEAALRRKMRVIPVLVGGAAMPQSPDLPAAIARFARREALEIRDAAFDDGAANLIAALKRLKAAQAAS